MKKNSIRFITEVAIFAALGLVLDFISGFYSKAIWPMGGSISLAMLPIFLMAIRHGLSGGLITGLLVGTIQILWGGSGVVYPIQTILDYTLAYTLVGVAGIYGNKIKSQETIQGKLFYITNGILLGTVLRTISHILSGYIYFREWTPDYFKTMPLTWSIIYNLGYMVPSLILCLLVIRILMNKYSDLILSDE